MGKTVLNRRPPGTNAQKLWRLVAAGMSGVLAVSRLQLAAKAALAAGLAFLIAPSMPGSAADYPYYAPLGALVVMYENVAGSMRQGLQTLVGLGLGIGLAFMLVSLGKPSPLTVAVVMGLGILLAGLPRLGAGRDWIPTAALLVLLVGGHNPDDFSFGYLLQMGVGVAVGIGVNLLVFPPLHFNAMAVSLAEFRRALAQQLSDMGDAVEEKWPPEHKDWSRRSEELAQSARALRAAVERADASRQANPRRKLHPRNVDLDYRDLRDLEKITFYVQDMTEVLADVIWDEDEPFIIPLPYSQPLADALSAVSALILAAQTEDSAQLQEFGKRADSAIEALAQQITSDEVSPDVPSAAESILLSLHRILRVVRPGLR